MADDNQIKGAGESKAAKQEMQITAEDEQLLIDLLRSYRTVVKAGKFVAVGFVGGLGFIVLLSQAWEAARSLLSRITGH